MKQEQIHDIFHHGSRFIIALPIMIIVLALVFKPNTTQTLSQSITPVPISSTPTRTVTIDPYLSPTLTSIPTPTGIPVDLQRPYIYNFFI